MSRETAKQVVRVMNVKMQAQDWPPVSLSGLPLSYAKRTTVTPYFSCSEVLLQPDGKYTIEGSIGVVHQGFEARWMKNEARKPLAPGFGVLLNILNIPQLRDKRYITTDTLESDVDDEGISLAQDLARNTLGVRSEVLGDVVVDGLEIGPSAGSR